MSDTFLVVIAVIALILVLAAIGIGIYFAVTHKTSTPPMPPVGGTIVLEPPPVSSIPRLGLSYDGPHLSLFQWNPHWQCFRNSCCYNEAISYINNNLSLRKVDFANIIELEDSNYQPPSGYRIIIAHCGSGSIHSGDVTTLIYNSNQWRPMGNAHKFCINPSGTVTEGRAGPRPTVIQQFSSIHDPSFSVYVVGSHFTHDRDTYVQGLHQAFNTVGITNQSRVVMMADTNQHGSSSALITDILGSSPPTVQATSISGTCCYSGFHLPYDRIISTFGSHMSTFAPSFNQVIRNTVSGCDYGEMHLPVFGVLS